MPQNPFADLISQQKKQAEPQQEASNDTNISSMSKDNPFADLAPKQEDPRKNLGHDAEAQEKFGTPEPGSIADILKDNPKKAPSTGNAFLDGVNAFNRPMDKMGEGLMQIVAKITGSDRLKKATSEVTAFNDAELAQSQKDSPTATSIGFGGGKAVELGALGGPGASGKLAGLGIKEGAKQLAKNSAVTGATSAAIGGLEAAAEDPDNMNNAAMISGAVGAAIPTALGAVVKTGKVAKGIVDAFIPQGSLSKYVSSILNPTAQATKEIARQVKNQVSGAEKTTNLQAAKLLKKAVPKDNKLSPGQALGGEKLVAEEKRLTVEAASEASLTRFHTKQTTEAVSDLKKSLKNITPAGNEATQEKASKLFNSMEDVKVPHEVQEVIAKDSGLSTVMKELNTSKFGLAKDMRNNSFPKIKALKEAIDEKLYVNGKALAENKMDKDDLAGLVSSREKLKTALAPYKEYTEALRLSEQVIVRRGYEKDLAKALATVPEGQSGLKEVHKALFGGAKALEKQETFYSDVIRTGGDPAMVEKMVTRLKKLNDGLLSPLLKANGEKVLDSSLGGNKQSVIQRFLGNVGLEKYKKALLDITLSGPKWRKDVLKVLEAKEGTAEAERKLLSLLSKAATDKPNAAIGAVVGGDINKATKPEKKKQGHLNIK